MQLSFDGRTRVLCIPAEKIAAFARRKSQDVPHGFQCVVHTEMFSADSFSEQPVSVLRSLDGRSCRVFSTVQSGKEENGETVCLSEKTVRRNLNRISLTDDPVFLALAMIRCAMLAEAENADTVTIFLRLWQESTGESKLWRGTFRRETLCLALNALYARAEPFLTLEAEQLLVGRKQWASLRFPYPTIREGQRDFVEALYRCARNGRNLLVSAPTGIGKTMSSVYPSFRALGAHYADRIFYFTAKTVTGNVALQAAKLLQQQSPSIRCIRLTAKERICPRRKQGENEYGMCRHCGNLSSQNGVSYEARRDAAMRAVLTEYPVADTADLVKTAAAYGVCPYELSLDVSEYCQMIVCDYGYLLDPYVRLQRYFVQEREEKYIFLLDEAHNLPDRAREIYSASLDRIAFAAFAEAARGALPDDKTLMEACTEVQEMFSQVEALCAEEAEVAEDGRRTGCILLKETPEFLWKPTARLRTVCDEYLRRDYENAAPIFEDMRTCLRRFGDAVGRMDDSFRLYAESDGENATVRILCLDPAGQLRNSFRQAVTTVLFSATLSPMEYYADVCGCRGAQQLELPSPYERENLCLIAVDSVSTRFSQRKRSAADIAELISVVTESHVGNYIVYFPSYSYMVTVCRQYMHLSAGGRVIMQKQGMTLSERDRFLREFAKSAERGDGVVAFCVLGGLFSEGIDLQGENLIGTVIVGMGLPGLSSELNILAEYYDQTRENGKEYAYLYPAVNKILQAAGRVIRSEKDRGAVVLIDDRYADPGVRRLFPGHWNQMQYTGDAYTLGVLLERFWEKNDTEET